MLTTIRSASVAIALALATPPARAQLMVTTPPDVATGWRATSVVEGLAKPWAMAWLPNGDMLITEIGGTVRKVSQGRLSRVPIETLPGLFVSGQGGLLDIAIKPGSTATDATVYLTFSSGTSAANQATLARGHYDGQRITQIEVLFAARPAKSGSEHFGSRLTWLPDGTLLMSVGDGGNPPRRVDGMLARDQAQDLSRHLGKILRLTADGKAPSDNPFAGRADARAEVWSFGHRNAQGLARDAATGRVWASEHGPRGGDELNVASAGVNFGWPLASYGHDYQTNQPIGVPSIAGASDPLLVWKPSVGPSGLTVYRGAVFPEWDGDVFTGSLVDSDVRRTVIGDDGAILRQERLPIGARVRDVRNGPDGYLYVLTDEASGKLIRIEPTR